ncbi:MAG: GNVR domain-containing protein [Syntrophales bacterium]|nr:GNVR domain-containing protein [Syntrophales bacterium]
MSEKARDRQFDISIYTSKYGVPILERKWMVLIFFLVGIFLALTLLSPLIKPKFVSQATLLVEEPRSAISQAKQETLGTGRVPGLYVTTEEEKIKSSFFAAEVLKILPEKAKSNLRAEVDIFPQIKAGALRLFGVRSKPVSQPLLEVSLLTEIQKRVEITSAPTSALIWITAKSTDRDVALVLARSYIDVCLASNLEDNKKAVSSERDFLEKQRNHAYQEFQDSEQAVFDYKKQYQIPGDFDEARDINIQLQMKRLQARVEMDKERFAELDGVYFTSQVKEAGIVGNIRVISPPAFPVAPSRKAEIRLMIIIILGGLMLGIGAALLPEFTQGTIRHEVDIVDVSHLPVLGHLPRIKL